MQRGRGQQERNHTEVLILQKKILAVRNAMRCPGKGGDGGAEPVGREKAKEDLKTKMTKMKRKSKLFLDAAKTEDEVHCPAFSTNRRKACQASTQSPQWL